MDLMSLATGPIGSLATGGLGGLIGGNLLGAAFRSKGVGAGSSSIVGIVVGAVATHFFGPTVGPIIASIAGNIDLAALLGNLLSGAGGGGIGALLYGILRSLMK